MKLMRGLLLEQGGDERQLERALAKKLGENVRGVGQQNINAVTRRKQNAGYDAADAISKFLDQDYGYYFGDEPAPYVVYGDLPGWSEAEKVVRELPEGQGLAVSAYIGARTFPIREKLRTPVKPRDLLRIVKKIDSMLGTKGHIAIGKFLDIDEIKKLEAQYMKNKGANFLAPTSNENTSVSRLKLP